MNFVSFPKLELHLHLDCSPSFKVLRRLDPSITAERYAQDFQLINKCIDLSDFLDRVPRILALMQQETYLTEFVFDLFEQLKADGVIYAEIRFAPLLHLREGLKAERVVAVVDEAVAKASAETGVQAGLILCTLRHFSQAQGVETVSLVKQFAKSQVVGLDLAADEANFPISPHLEAFRLAEKWGLHRTAHAGEALGAASVIQTIEQLRPERLGHGVRSIEEPQLIEELVKRDLHLEICPTCNVLINVFESWPEHPVDLLYRAGVSLGINTDGRTVPALSLSGEYRKLSQTFGWGPKQFLKCNLNALKAAFIDEDRKPQLEKILRSGYDQL